MRWLRRSYEQSSHDLYAAPQDGASAERTNDLVGLRPASLALLGEDEPSVGDDVELALLARDRFRLVRRLFVQLGRETRGPSVIAVSDGAVEDLDMRHAADFSGVTRR